MCPSCVHSTLSTTVPSPKHCTSTSFSLHGGHTLYITSYEQTTVHSWISLYTLGNPCISTVIIHGRYSWALSQLCVYCLPSHTCIECSSRSSFVTNHWMETLLLDTGYNLAMAGPRWWYSSRHLKHTHSLWNPLGHSLGWVLQNRTQKVN